MAQEKVDRNVWRWKNLTDDTEEGVVQQLNDLKAFAELFTGWANTGDMPADEGVMASAADLLARMVEGLEQALERVVEKNIAEIKAEATA